jgi:uncharacterized protein
LAKRTATDADAPFSRAQVEFPSGAYRLAGTLMVPNADDTAQWPCVIQGPGWMGLRSAALYRPYHEALLSAGLAVLTIDYRGFGDSEGSIGRLDPSEQVEDLQAAAQYLETRGDIDPSRLGIFGSGGTGGGNAIMAAAQDDRFRAVVSQVPIADGHEWLRGMRSEEEWLTFVSAMNADRRNRNAGQQPVLVPPSEIVIPTRERLKTTVKADVDRRVPQLLELATAEALFDYRPVDVVGTIAPRALMVICVESDSTTPESHAYALFERAGRPKRLVVQKGTSHYAAYDQYRDQVAPLIAAWFTEYVSTSDAHTSHGPLVSDTVFLGHAVSADDRP